MLRRAIRALVLVVGVCLAVAVEPVLAAPGDLVRSFGRNGVTELSVPLSEQVHANDVAAAPDGGLYVLRTNYGYGTFGGARIERLRPNGSPNPAFGGDGSVAVPGGDVGSRSLAVASDGKVIVAGSTYLTRIHPDGSLDTSFGKAGFLGAQVTGGPNGRPEGDIASFGIQGDGRIVVAVDRGRSAGEPVVGLSRYLPDGTPDPSFGGGSPVTIDLETGEAGIALLGGDGLAVAGNPCCFRPGAARVLRILGDGSVDSAFSQGGLSRINAPSEPVHVSAILVQPGGKIVVMATHESGTFSTFLMRFLPSGKRDASFGKRGALDLGRAESDWPVLLDRRGRLTVAVLQRNESNPKGGSARGPARVTLRRFTPDGHVDRTFGGGRIVQLYRLPWAEPVSAALTTAGRISVLMQTGVCARSCTTFHSYLAQWKGGSSKARCLGHRATIVGTSGRDVVRGTPHRDVIATLGGNDAVRAGGGNDLVCGGAGNDFLVGGRGQDRVRQ
jgi:uncharacterized delta-60 repeat protein